MPDETVIETETEDEVEQEVQTALSIEPAFAQIQPSGARDLVSQLQLMDDAEVIFKRRCALLEACQTMAIRATRPEDWVLSKSKSGETTAMLCAPGAQVVAQHYGIEVVNIRPRGPRGEFRPEERRGENGELSLTAWCDAISHITGKSIEGIEASRSSKEDFTGRSDATGASKLVQLNDLRSSLYTLLLTKSCRILAGLSRVPVETLDAAWEGTTKSSDRCRKGSGFGSGSARAAAGVSEVDAKARKELADELLRRTGGDKQAAKDVLKEITAGKNFAGFDTTERITKSWQLENAWSKLKEHPVFGDAAQQGGGNG